MNLKQCENKHYYDSDKYSQCPHCVEKQRKNPIDEQPVSMGSSEFSFGGFSDNDFFDTEEKKQEPEEKMFSGVETFTERKPVSVPQDDMGVTIGAFEDDYIVGWLVAVEGQHKGESFNLKEGMNYIGRSTNMDVCLLKDEGVSRNKHVVIIYDAKNNQFILNMGESKELAYVNDELLLAPKKLEKNDTISIGKSKLVFVPFCDENFSWEE